MSLYGTSNTAWFLRLQGWRFRAGLMAFYGVMLVLGLLFCGGIGSGCSADQGAPMVGLVFIIGVELWLVIALVSGKGRRVAFGFLAGLLSASLVINGALMKVWGMPFMAVAQLARPIWGPIQAASARSAEREQWVGTRRTEFPTVVRGERLLNALQECVVRYRAMDSLSSFPRDASQLTAANACTDADYLRAADQPHDRWYDNADYGWRWTYAPAPADSLGRVASYSLRVFEDPVIARPAPSFVGDESGAMRRIEAGKPPRFASSAVHSLVLLRRCMQRVPAEHQRLNAEFGWDRPPAPFHEVIAVCPELKDHIGTSYPDRDFGTLALSADDVQGAFVDTVAVYTIELVPADVEGLVFELKARQRPTRNRFIRSGPRRFFVARDGSIHATTGQADATEADPLVVECTEGEPAACGDAPAQPTPAAGS